MSAETSGRYRELILRSPLLPPERIAEAKAKGGPRTALLCRCMGTAGSAASSAVESAYCQTQIGDAPETREGSSAHTGGIPPVRSRRKPIMDKEHLKGAADKAKGAMKDAAGKLMDDKELQAEGKMDKAKGGARQALGDAKDAVKRGQEKA